MDDSFVLTPLYCEKASVGWELLRWPAGDIITSSSESFPLHLDRHHSYSSIHRTNTNIEIPRI